jgi:hypothetical protein
MFGSRPGMARNGELSILPQLYPGLRFGSINLTKPEIGQKHSGGRGLQRISKEKLYNRIFGVGDRASREAHGTSDSLKH